MLAHGSSFLCEHFLPHCASSCHNLTWTARYNALDGSGQMFPLDSKGLLMYNNEQVSNMYLEQGDEQEVLLLAKNEQRKGAQDHGGPI